MRKQIDKLAIGSTISGELISRRTHQELYRILSREESRDMLPYGEIGCIDASL